MGGGGALDGTNLPFNDMLGYEFKLVVSDLYESATASNEMPTKEVYFDLDESNGSIGFGGESISDEDTKRYDFYGPIYAHGMIYANAGFDGVVSHTQTANGWAIKFGSNSGVMIQIKQMTGATGTYQAWGDIFYADVVLGDWDIPFDTLFGAVGNIDIGTMANSPSGCALWGATTTSAGGIRSTKGTNYGVNYTACAIGFGTWSQTT